jgi:bifunctional oligoribonuclease and PAP phosphatase NrnA
LQIPEKVRNLLYSAFEQARTAIHKSGRIWISTHRNPDGDAIGSELALYHALTAIGKKVEIVNCDPTPNNLMFTDKDSIIKSHENYQFDVSEVDLIIIADLNDSSRLGTLATIFNESKAYKLLIDHHTEANINVDLSIVNTQATSTGELVYYFLNFLEIEMNSDIAQNLYLAIMTDTGSFRFPRTDASTHQIVADIMQYDVDPVEIYEQVYNTNTINSIHILGSALKNITLHYGGKLAIMRISAEMLRSANASNDDIDNFVNHTLSINGTKIGVMIAEVLGSDELRISMRSKGKYSARKISSHFGGGGHLNAAGARVKNISLNEAYNQIIKFAESVIESAGIENE